MIEATNMIEVFKSEDFGEIRTLNINGEPWFVAKDIAEVLGYTNPTKAMQDHVEQEDATFNESLKLSRQSGAWLINESGLYSLVLSSKLPTAKKFKRWVTSEVLPSIRKHGMYAVEELLSNPDFAIKTFTALKEEREKRLMLEEKIEADKPLVEFANHVSNASNLIDIGTLAKIAKDEHIDFGRTRLFDWLRENGYLMSSAGNKNQPYQKYVEQGLFKVREYTYTTPYGDKVGTKTMVTGKGQMFFIEKLRALFGTKAETVSENN